MWKKFLDGWAKYEKIVTIAFFAIVLILPLFIERKYYLTVMVMCGMYILLSLSMNMVTGYLGIVVLGQAAFYGVGAYAAAIFATRITSWIGSEFIVTAIIAAAVAAVFGLMLGWPTMRVRGSYMSIVTLGFCEITRIVELNWMSVTRGPFGIPNIPLPTFFTFEVESAKAFYYMIIIIVMVITLMISNINNSRTGRAFAAIKGDEIAAQSMGININNYKVMCFAVSAAIAGIAGAFHAHYYSYIDSTTFTSDKSFEILGQTILGGLGNTAGSYFGAIALTVLPEVLRPIAAYRQIIYGIILALMVIIKPTGILGGFNLKHIRQQNNFAKGIDK